MKKELTSSNPLIKDFINSVKQKPISKEDKLTAIPIEGSRNPNELIEPLTGRELEVLRLLADGLKYNEIADRLHISTNTIENHMSHAIKTIREKMGKYSLTSILFLFLFV